MGSYSFPLQASITDMFVEMNTIRAYTSLGAGVYLENAVLCYSLLAAVVWPCWA